MTNVTATLYEFGFIFILVISRYENNFKAHIRTIRFHCYEWMRWMGFSNLIFLTNHFFSLHCKHYESPATYHEFIRTEGKKSWHGNFMDMKNESIRSCNTAQVAKGEEINNIQTTQGAERKQWDHSERRVLQDQHCLCSFIVSWRVEAADKFY